MFETQKCQSAPEVGILRTISSASSNGRFRDFEEEIQSDAASYTIAYKSSQPVLL